MSAFTKHPSTHVFFHVQDKSAAQQASPPGGAARRSGASSLGLGGHKPQGLSLATGSRLSADHASLLAHGPHGHFGSMMGATGAPGHHHASHITSHLSGHQQQAGVPQPHRPVSTILSGGSSSPHAGGEWDDFDLFCQSPYPRLSPLGPHSQFPGQSCHHPLDSQLIEETSLSGPPPPPPLNAQPAFPSAYGIAGGGISSGSVGGGGGGGGGRMGGRAIGGGAGPGGGGAGPGSGVEDDGGSGSKAPPPRLRSNSYYSIPLVESSGHNPTAATEDHRGTDHRALAEAYEYHRGAPMVGGGAHEWEGDVSLLSGGSRGGGRFDHPTKGGLRPPGVNSPASGKWGNEWDMHGQGPQGIVQGQHGPPTTAGARRPQDMTREPLAPANRTNAYHLKYGQYTGAWGDAKGQRGAENLAGLGFEGLSPPPPANPVDVLTVSARMLHRILPGVVQPLKVGQCTSLCGLAVSSIHVTERDTCVVMDMCESAGFCARDLPSPATELLPLPRDWISVQLARHKHTFGWFKHNYNTTTASHRDSHKGHIPHHPLAQQGGQQTGRGQHHTPKGLLLMNVERNSQFPFMTVLSCRETEVARLIRELDELHLPPGLGPPMGGMGGLGGSIGGSMANLANTCGGQLAFGAPGYCANCSNATTDFQPMSAQQTRIHHTGAYIEVASLARRKGGGQVMGPGAMPFGGPMEDPLDSLGRNKKMTGRQDLDDSRLSGAPPQSTSALDDDEDVASTGYIVSFFRVFPGEDSERLDRSWPLWTGARQIHGRLPKCVGLNRISFHKKIDPHSSGITYVLLCECPRIMDYLTEACVLVDQLRARCCGYTALYRVIDSF